MRNNTRPSRPGAKPSGRPKRAYGSRDGKPYDSERPKRSSDSTSERPKSNYGSRDGKPFDRERKPYSSDRPKRTFDSDRPKRAYGSRDDKPFDRERKPYDSDRPKRTFDSDRPKRTYVKRDDSSENAEAKTFQKTSLSFDNDRPKSFGEDHAERPYRESRPRAEEYVPKPRRRKAVDEVGIRLNKFISNSGICSRREADDYITAGLVSVNGQIITELGTKIQAQDDVRFNGERLRGEEKVYILMNKPKDFVTTLSDPNADKTVMDLLAGNCSQRVYPVGRLDKSTTGVLLLTNDGEMAEKLTHPSNLNKKIYHVFLDKNLSGSDFKALLDGITLEDGLMHADSLSYIDEDKTQVGLEIHSGRNRVVRRMFEHLGYKVKKLDRVFFAGLTKKNLRRGQWRFLTEQEIAMLKMGAFE